MPLCKFFRGFGSTSLQLVFPQALALFSLLFLFFDLFFLYCLAHSARTIHPFLLFSYHTTLGYDDSFHSGGARRRAGQTRCAASIFYNLFWSLSSRSAWGCYVFKKILQHKSPFSIHCGVYASPSRRSVLSRLSCK